MILLKRNDKIDTSWSNTAIIKECTIVQCVNVHDYFSDTIRYVDPETKLKLHGSLHCFTYVPKKSPEYATYKEANHNG